MNNKKTLYIIGAVVLLALILLLAVWKPTADKKDAETAQNTPETVLQTGTEQPQAAETSQSETEDGEPASQDGSSENTGAQLLEDGGDIIITIPDDEESDGF